MPWIGFGKKGSGDKIPLTPNKGAPANSPVSKTEGSTDKKKKKKKKSSGELKIQGPPQIANFGTVVAMENRLAVRTEAKTKAVDEARKMQSYVNEECKKTGKDPPPYGLEELIGKGSFGRVYKGKNMKDAKVVAIKIIDIDESDTLNPRNADSYSEFMKEVSALTLLSENKAKNINHVIEALPVGQAMWMIAEYCGGGSVATLMKPTLPGGLMEKWIVIILREVAEGLRWVHAAGIIHRDIKSANVLVTEEGEVQVCDFGVAGITEHKADKRSTIIGTPHWMAPELFKQSASYGKGYGKEIDIWAFGAMIWELATGAPPNKTVPSDLLGHSLKQKSLRLEDEGDYSDAICDLVAYCLQEDPKARPTIEQIQQHRYIFNTQTSHPTSSLRTLVLAFKKWETEGGTRRSLFWEHGAQGPSTSASPAEDDEWIFSTTEAFDNNYLPRINTQEVDAAYVFPQNGNDDGGQTARPSQQAPRSRRRGPPNALKRPPPVAPLERIFDPNTMSNYADNSRSRYGREMSSDFNDDTARLSIGRQISSDLPLRDDTVQASNRETLINLDLDLGTSNFQEMNTIRANPRGVDYNSDAGPSTLHDFSRPALSDPADLNPNRRDTRDWKFPAPEDPPASADPEMSRFPTTYEVSRPFITPGSSNGRPPLIHHPTEPIGSFGSSFMMHSSDRQSFMIDLDEAETSDPVSRESRIDLDMAGFPAPIPEYRRPSTANSDAGSTTGNPFELEKHASMQLQPPVVREGREPSLLLDDSSLTSFHQNSIRLDPAEMSDFSASDAEGGHSNGYNSSKTPSLYGDEDAGYEPVKSIRGRTSLEESSDYHGTMAPPQLFTQFPPRESSRRQVSFPPIAPPDPRAFEGSSSNQILADEVIRMMDSMVNSLDNFGELYRNMPTTSSSQRRR